MSADPPVAKLRTSFCERTGVDVPVVQTGMGWVSGARLTAATSEAGGLGILASATMSVEELDGAIAKVRRRTSRPLGVNLLPSTPDAAERIELLVEREVEVASFAAAPRPEQVAALESAGVLTIVTVGAPRHAEKVAAMGVSAVIAQGAEGGGHTGSIPTSLLVPAVVDVLDGSGVMVLAAGGMRDGTGLATALGWGAAGIAMGTRFLLTAESHVPEEVKAVYLASGLLSTVVTSAIDGAPQRVIRTPFVDSLETAGGLRRLLRATANAVRFARRSGTSPLDLARTARSMHADGDLSWSQVIMAANAPMMTRASLLGGELDAGILPTGQVVGTIDDLPTVAELMGRIVTEAGDALDRLCGGS